LGQLGVLYPSAGRPTSCDESKFGHHLLAWSIAEQRGIDRSHPCWRQLRDEIEYTRPGLVIVSSETFEHFTKDQIAEIREHLADFRVRIIVYLRNYSDFIISRFKQRQDEHSENPFSRECLDITIDM
jgi:hypothetical protein